jgi:PAS domain S-box-containing protein
MANEDPAYIEKLLRLLPQQNPDHGILLISPEGRIVWANPAAEQILGCPASDIQGSPDSRFFTAEDIGKGIPQHEKNIACSHGTSEDDRWQMRPDGSRFWASGVMVALRDSTAALLGFGKIFRNRTDWKEQLETLKNEAQALSRADRQKDLFLATLAHELRHPLAPLANAVQLLRMVAPGNPDLEYPVKLIERQVDFIDRMVNDLLDRTRISTGKMQLHMERLALHEVIERAVEAVRPLVDQRHQHLAVLPLAEPILVEGDSARLQQVFINLVENAAKYTPDGGHIWVKMTVEENEAVVRVEDTGIGIAPEVLSNIFEMFTQVGTSKEQSGLGIGLALVKDLVTLHGGTVQANSNGSGKGSEFIVRLPMMESDAEPHGAAPSSPPPESLFEQE